MIQEEAKAMREPIDTTATRLQSMSVADLQDRYAEVFGEPTRVKHKHHLIRRILWRVQALSEGDLSERARRRAEELASDAEIRLTAPRRIEPKGGNVLLASFPSGDETGALVAGSILRRDYKGRLVEVRVLPGGFEYEGKTYRSLTAVARRITGSHWSGPGFFNLPSAPVAAAARGGVGE